MAVSSGQMDFYEQHRNVLGAVCDKGSTHAPLLLRELSLLSMQTPLAIRWPLQAPSSGPRPKGRLLSRGAGEIEKDAPIHSKADVVKRHFRSAWSGAEVVAP